MAIHYREVHPGQTPELRFKLLTVEPATVLRKVYEAHSIYNLKPELNNKGGVSDIRKVLGQRECELE